MVEANLNLILDACSKDIPQQSIETYIDSNGRRKTTLRPAVINTPRGLEQLNCDKTKIYHEKYYRVKYHEDYSQSDIKTTPFRHKFLFNDVSDSSQTSERSLDSAMSSHINACFKGIPFQDNSLTTSSLVLMPNSGASKYPRYNPKGDLLRGQKIPVSARPQGGKCQDGASNSKTRPVFPCIRTFNIESPAFSNSTSNGDGDLDDQSSMDSSQTLRLPLILPKRESDDQYASSEIEAFDNMDMQELSNSENGLDSLKERNNKGYLTREKTRCKKSQENKRTIKDDVPMKHLSMGNTSFTRKKYEDPFRKKRKTSETLKKISSVIGSKAPTENGALNDVKDPKRLYKTLLEDGCLVDESTYDMFAHKATSRGCQRKTALAQLKTGSSQMSPGYALRTRTTLKPEHLGAQKTTAMYVERGRVGLDQQFYKESHMNNVLGGE